MRGLWSPAWLARHLTALAMIVGCALLARWQLGRASAGNTLSWAYAVQWPLFAGFVALIWFREVCSAVQADRPPAAHPAPDLPARAARRPVLTPRRPPPPPYDDADPDLARYNRYLAWLSANPGARPTDYPG